MAKKVVKEQKKKLNLDFSFAAYLLGIIAVVDSFISPIAGVIFGIIGLVFSKKEKNEISRKAKILNIIGIVVGTIFFLFSIALLFVQLPTLVE